MVKTLKFKVFKKKKIQKTGTEALYIKLTLRKCACFFKIHLFRIKSILE